MHWAEPLFSLYLIGFNLDAPYIVNGKKLFFLNSNLAPNLLSGSDTLLKSLLDRLLSPIKLIGSGEFIKSPRISRPSVPEFCAFIVRFFYIYIHLFPSQNFTFIFLTIVLIPSFLTASIAAKTSSDIKRFFAFDVPSAKEANSTHLILKLLSPGTFIVFLKLLIFLF